MDGTPQSDPGGTAPQPPPGDVRCPACATPLPLPAEPSWVVCPGCGRTLDPLAAVRAAQYQGQAEYAAGYAAQAGAAAHEAIAQAQHWAAVAAQWRAAANAQQAQVFAWQPPVSAPAPERPKREIPTAVLLQGTGAVLILGAVVLVSAVAWTLLPTAGQLALMAAIVAVLGGLALATRTRVPTTSLILAGLTAAVYVVLAATVPVLVGGTDWRWYPFAAAAAGTGLLWVAGVLGHMTLWRHLSRLALAVTALLFVAAVVEPAPAAPRLWSLGVILLAVLSAALLWVAVREHHEDAETATTAFWSAALLTAITCLGGVAILLAAIAAAAPPAPADRAVLAAAVAAVALLLIGLARSLPATGRNTPAALHHAGGVVAPLAVAILATPAVADPAALALLPAAALTATLVAASALLRRARLLAVWGAATGAFFLLWPIAIGQQGDWQWLELVAISLVTAAFLIVVGGLVRAALPIAFGQALALAAWLFAWLGDDLGTEPEVFTLPVAAALIGSDLWAGHRCGRAVAGSLGRSGLVVAAAAPGLLAALFVFAADGVLQWQRLGLVAALAVTTALVGRPARGALTMGAGLAAVGTASFAIVALIRADVRFVEPYAAIAALVVVATLAVAAHEGLTRRMTTAARAGAAVLVVPPTLVALADPGFDLPHAVVRGMGVAVLCAALVVLGWRNLPVLAAAAGSVGLILIGEWYVAALRERPAADVLEAWTLPMAALATAALLLWRHAAPGIPRWAPAVPGGVAAVASTALALLDPELAAPWAGPRAVVLVVGYATVLAVTWRRIPAAAAGAGTVLLWLATEWYLAALAGPPRYELLEAWTVPPALAATAGVWLWHRAFPQRVAPGLLAAPAALVLLTSTAATLVNPLGGADRTDSLRVVTVLLAWWGTAVALRNRTGPFLVAALAAVWLTWFQVVSAVRTIGSMAEPEVYTWSAAVAAAVGSLLILRARGKGVTTLLTVAPPVALVLIPTGARAWQSGTAGWRVWFVLVVAGSVLAFGVHRRWAGAVYPALLALALVVVPVMTRLASDAPAWVPLAVVGSALLLLGARFESLRRQGREAAHWAATLH